MTLNFRSSCLCLLSVKDYRHELLCLVYAMLETDPRALSVLGRHSTLLAAFPAVCANFQDKQNVWKACNKHGRSLLSPVFVETNVPPVSDIQPSLFPTLDAAVQVHITASLSAYPSRDGAASVSL